MQGRELSTEFPPFTFHVAYRATAKPPRNSGFLQVLRNELSQLNSVESSTLTQIVTGQN